MAEMVSVTEAKTHLSELLARVAQGEEVIICRRGKPVAKLVPIEPVRERRLPGTMAGQIWMSDDFDEMSEEELALFYDGAIEPEDA